MDNFPVIAVVVPAYNEVNTLEATIRPFMDLNIVSKVVVVDNNSNDGTLELVEDLVSKHSKLTVLRELKQGKGYAVRRAFRAITADFYVLVDADSTYSANDFLKLLTVSLKEEVDLVVGNRHADSVYANQNLRRFHNLGNKMIKRIINKLYSSSLEDILSGYRIMTWSFVKNFPIQSRGFELETEITLHALDRGYSIAEVPISYYPRPDGSSPKLRTFHDGSRILFRIFKIYRIFQPLRFFGSISCIFFTAALAFGYQPLSDYIKFQYVFHVPLAVLSSSFIVLSALALMTAFILDAVADLSAKNFETSKNTAKNER
jgi:glycosyltransferase involved in cell wall biosynthesis